jgi:hypothetical protein
MYRYDYSVTLHARVKTPKIGHLKGLKSSQTSLHFFIKGYICEHWQFGVSAKVLK